MNDLIQKITFLGNKKERFLIAIDGRGGSGKSTLASYLTKKISNVTILPIDDFLHSEIIIPELGKLKNDVIMPFQKGETGKYQKYDWSTQKLADLITIKPEGILIVEGVYSLSYEIVDFFDYKIWVEYPANLALARGIRRDTEEYKVETGEYWKKWIIKEQEYIDKEKPQEKADYIVDGSQVFK